MSVKTPLLVSPCGLNEVDHKVFRVAINLLAGEGIACRLLPVNDCNGHVLVVDTSFANSDAILNKARKGQVRLLLSNDRVAGKNLVSIEKPVRVAAVMDLLTTLSRHLQTQIQASGVPAPGQQVVSAPAENLSGIENTLFHILYHAKRNPQRLRIINDGLPDLLVNSFNGTVATSADHGTLESILRIPYNRCEVNEVSETTLARLSKGLELMALDGVLWQAGILCSRGQLLTGHKTDVPIRLKIWPNFTRHGFRPKYFRIAAILARQAVSLDELRRLTGVAAEDIADFYNAAYAVGLIERRKTARPRHDVYEPQAINQERKSLIQRLATRLGFG